MTTGLEGRLGQVPEESIKSPVVASTTEDIFLHGEQTINTTPNVSPLVSGDRVLVRSQADARENGIYVVSTTAWTRTNDFNDVNDIINGQGVTDSNKFNPDESAVWLVKISDGYIIDSSDIEFTRAIDRTGFGELDVEAYNELSGLNKKLNGYADKADVIANAPKVVGSKLSINSTDGGNFIYVASSDFKSSGTTAAGVFISDGVGTGGWERQGYTGGIVNIIWFGAIGDGTWNFGGISTGTDNGALFHDLMEEYGAFHVPKGNFLYSTQIDIKERGGVITGDNEYNCKLLYMGAAGTSGILVDPQGATSPVQYMRLEKFQLQIGHEQDVHGVTIDHLKNGRIANCLILGNRNPNNSHTLLGKGINMIGNVYILSIERVFPKLFDTGIYFGQTGDYSGDIVLYGQGEIHNNNVGIQMGDINVGSSAHITVRDYTIEGNYQKGVVILGGLQNIHIENVFFEANADLDIQIGNDTYTAGVNDDSRTLLGVNIIGCKLDTLGTKTKVQINKGKYLSFKRNRVQASSTIADSKAFTVPAEVVAGTVDNLVFEDNITGNALAYDVPDTVPNYHVDDAVYYTSVGTNANGRYIKMKDGTLICTKTISGTAAITTARGNAFIGGNVADTGFAHAFITNDWTQTLTLFQATQPIWLVANASTQRNAIRFQFGAFISEASVDYEVDVVQIGRWK